MGENILPGKVLTGGGSDDKSVCIWDLETEKLERRLLGALGMLSPPPVVASFPTVTLSTRLGTMYMF